MACTAWMLSRAISTSGIASHPTRTQREDKRNERPPRSGRRSRASGLGQPPLPLPWAFAAPPPCPGSAVVTPAAAPVLAPVTMPLGALPPAVPFDVATGALPPDAVTT